MKTIHIDVQDTKNVSPYLFGHNLEHTRAAMSGGLSAQKLRNRKFAGKPSKNEGCPQDWYAIGGKNAYFTMEGRWGDDDEYVSAYTRHWKPVSIPNRYGESNVFVVQNATENGTCGFGQHEIAILAGECYEFRMVTKCAVAGEVHVQLTNRSGDVVYAEKTVSLIPGEWQISEFSLVPNQKDEDACVRYTFDKRMWVAFGALSMLPKGHFYGMRRDVIEQMKELGITMLRWPGGCYATDYRWQDGLFPVDMRSPIQSRAINETLPYTRGYDDHEMGTDEFIALCRELGAEPYITINPVWDTPEETRAWVEYCNGSADTEFGRMRAERGHTEPYNVKFWALGNEFGYNPYGEGPHVPEKYAVVAREYADAMLKVTPDLVLFSSGNHPDKAWADKSAKVLADKAEYVSLHWYSNTSQNFSTPEAIRRGCKKLFAAPRDEVLMRMEKTREYLGDNIHIAFDEWNCWYAWYRPGSVAQGIYTAEVLHLFLLESERLDIPVCCYFQPVGEGAIEVDPYQCSMTASGQVFSFLKAHKDGSLCRLDHVNDYEAAATIHNGVLTVTLINMDLDENQVFSMNLCGTPISAKVLQSDSVLPHSRFTENDLEIKVEGGMLTTELPPHSIAKICMKVQ